MRRPVLLAGIAVAGLMLALVPASAATAADDNLLANPGFETGALSPWHCTGQAEVTGTDTHSGGYALRATPTSTDTAQCSQQVDVAPNSAYTLSAWVRGSYVYLGATGTGGSDPSTWGSPSDWSQLTTTFTTGPSTTSVTVYLHGWYGQPAFDVDDVALRGPAGGGGGGQGDQAPAAPTGLTVTGTTDSSVSLSWQASDTATGYRVYVDGDRAADVSSTGTTVGSLAADTVYTLTVTAYNDAGESQPSAPVSATTRASGGTHTGHQLVGYLHASFANGSGYLRIQDVPDDWSVIALAFADADSGGHVTFTPCPVSECGSQAEDTEELKAGIAAQQAAGKKVVISIGGANGEVTLSTTAARDAFVSSVESIIDTYGLDGVDLDFENQSLVLQPGDTDLAHPTTPAVVNLISAVRTLHDHYGSGFVLTMAPETFMVQLGYQFYGGDPNTGADRRAGSWLPVIYGLRDELTLLDVQLYNSGPITGLDNQYHTMGGADFVIAMTDMLTAGFPVAGTGQTFPALPADKLGVGLPANQYAGNGFLSPSVVDTALDCLTTGTGCGGYTLRGGTHPELAGLMTWSINWDRYNGYQFSHNYDSYFG